MFAPVDSDCYCGCGGRGPTHSQRNAHRIGIRPLQDKNDSFAEIVTLRSRIEEALKSFKKIRESLENKLPNAALLQITKQASDMSEYFRILLQEYNNNLNYMKDRLYFLEIQAKLLEQTGWLPHETTPFDLLDKHDNSSLEELSQNIEDYYLMNWPIIKDIILGRINSYLIDVDAKDALRESLNCHGYGMYQSVCRNLFPEMERVSRIELHNGNLASKVTSQELLRKTAGSMHLSGIGLNGYLACQLFGCLDEHLYLHVRSESERDKIKDKTTPNRHAVIHGLVSYRSHQNSINTIIMCDFVFKIIHSLKTTG